MESLASNIAVFLDIPTSPICLLLFLTVNMFFRYVFIIYVLFSLVTGILHRLQPLPVMVVDQPVSLIWLSLIKEVSEQLYHKCCWKVKFILLTSCNALLLISFFTAPSIPTVPPQIDPSPNITLPTDYPSDPITHNTLTFVLPLPPEDDGELTVVFIIVQAGLKNESDPTKLRRK